MMTKDEKNQKIISLLSEIIYEVYEDLKKGNIKQAVGKSATKSQTFHQTAIDFKK